MRGGAVVAGFKRQLKLAVFAILAAGLVGSSSALAASTADAGAGSTIFVDSPERARVLAQSWLRHAMAWGFTIGTVEDVGLVYVVSIVREDDPSKLRDHLIVRKQDGYAFPVFPLAPPGADVEMGTGGMSGMGG